MAPTAKRARTAPAPQPAYTATQFMVAALSDAQQAELLRWLVGEQERSGVLQHAKRWLRRCGIAGCSRAPRTERDAEEAAGRVCPECERILCVTHYEDMLPVCANAACACSADVCCGQCSDLFCDGCNEPLCRDCWRAGNARNLCEACVRDGGGGGGGGG